MNVGPVVKNILAAIGGVLLLTTLTVIGWIAIQVWDLRPAVAEMRPLVTETAKRVDRIADALPDVRVRVAREDLGKRIQALLIATDPAEIKEGEWVAAVHLLDFAAGKRITYVVPVRGRADTLVSNWVTGLAVRTAKEQISLQDYVRASISAGVPTSLPSFVEPDASYAIIKSATDYSRELRYQWKGLAAREAPLPPGGPRKWDQVEKELARDERSLRPEAIPKGVGGPEVPFK